MIKCTKLTKTTIEQLVLMTKNANNKSKSNHSIKEVVQKRNYKLILNYLKLCYL